MKRQDNPLYFSQWVDRKTNYNLFSVGTTVGYWVGYKAALRDNDILNETEIEEPKIKERFSLKEIKAEIKHFFENNDGKEIGYIELMEEFNFSLPDIVDACNQLLEEGQIGEID